MEGFTKVIGSMTEGMAKALRNTAMEMSMRESLQEERPMGSVFTNGKMVRSTKGIGLMGKKMVKGHGQVIFCVFLTCSDKYGESYVGEWRENKANGKGVHIWATGDKYEGDWFEFLKHGYGTDFFANGDKYIGQYRYGKPWGRGRYEWSSGAVYEGEFEEGHKHGKGRWEKKQMMKDDQTGQEAEVLVLYEGEYRNDVKDGFGEYRWASGNVYKGYYNKDKRHYYGEMFWNDGSIYKGEWYEGVQHGYGKMIFATGEIKEGFFDNGVFKFEGNESQIKAFMMKNNIK